MVKNFSKIRFRIYIICIYLILLPIDATLGNFLGSISLVNYLIIIYILLRIVSYILLNEKVNLKVLADCRVPFLYFFYFITSMSWAITSELNSWYIFSLIGSFSMFIFSSMDIYSDYEHKFLKKTIVISGIILLIVCFFNYNINSDSRFILNLGRYMDPNYFSIGLVLITAVLMENIIENKKIFMSLFILTLMFILILLTGSRGGLLANGVVVFPFLLFSKKNIFKKLYLILSILLILIITFYYMSHLIPEWILNRFTINEALNDKGSGRTLIWNADISFYKNLDFFRLLFGTGFTSQSYVSLLMIGIPKVSHNIYMQSLIEGGIIGLLLMLMLIITTLFRSIKNKNIYVFAAIMGAAVGGLTLDIHISRFFWNIIFFSMLPRIKKEDLK